jgi:hypothetical protein
MGGFGEEARSGGFLGGCCVGLGCGGAPPLLYCSLQARGLILHSGPRSVQILYKCHSPQMFAANTTIIEKGEGRLGNVAGWVK